MVRVFFLLLAAVWPTLWLQGQSKSMLTGQVTDSDGQPIPNVHIFLRQARQGTITNADGRFSLRRPAAADTLTASYIGYTTYRRATAHATDTIAIRLGRAENRLDELTVTNLTAAELLQRAVDRIPQNYPQTAVLTHYFYRGTMSNATDDTLLYAEESAFEQIKTYRRGMRDRTFLQRNRVFRFGDRKHRIRGIGLFDYVKQMVDRNLTIEKNSFTYGPFSSYDNRPLYTVEVNADRPATTRLRGRVYIDAEDLAIVRTEFVRPGLQNTIQYKKIDSLYMLVSGHHVNTEKTKENEIRLEADWVLTNVERDFEPDSIKGVWIRDEQHEILQSTPLHADDSAFWIQHNRMLPDATLQQQIVAQQRQTDADASLLPTGFSPPTRLYNPHIAWTVSTQWSTDLTALAQTVSSINRLTHYAFNQKLRNIFVGTLLGTAFNYYILSPPEELAAERALLANNKIDARAKLWAFDRFGRSYHAGTSAQLAQLKTTDREAFMRLHTARNEYRYVKARLLEDDIVRAGKSNANNLLDYMRYLLPDLVYNRISNVDIAPLKEVKAASITDDASMPLVVDPVKSWVKHLFEPEAEAMRHVTRSDLNDAEVRYLRRSARLSWLNIVSMPMFGISRVSLGRGWEASVSLSHLRVPFGQLTEQNLWVAHRSRLHGLLVRQYANHERNGWGVGYRLYDLPLGRRLQLTSGIDWWQQPDQQGFYDHAWRNGFRLMQQLNYRLWADPYRKVDRLTITGGYDLKTAGYVPGNLRTSAGLNINIGLRIGL